jgi:hypothetical protein
MKTSHLLLSLMVISAPGFSDSMCSKKKQPAQNTNSLQGEPLTCHQAAYNAPAAIDVRSKYDQCRSSDLTGFIDASFTYWYAGEDGLKIASNGVANSNIFYYALNTRTLTQSFDYHPGFKVSAGLVSQHEWTVKAEYTWFRGKTTTNSNTLSATEETAGTATALTGTSVWVVDDWFLQGTGNGQALSGSQVSSSWKLALDLIDATLSRPFYQGQSLTVEPFGGLRAALIRQSMTVELNELAGLFTSMPTQPIGSRNHSNSWAIGPRIGYGANCLLPMGFRFENDFALSLLYTKYTSIKHSEDAASLAFNPGPYNASLNSYSTLRPIAELGLGLGWGTYFYDQRYHIDFAATYDFMFFWSQNMTREIIDHTLTGTGPASSDLYLHGLTITGRFDF